MAYWVHCNVCLSQQTAVISKLYLTSCGHMICENCYRRTGSDNKCTKCGNVGEIILIDENLPSNIKMFFTSPVGILKEANTAIQQAINVQEFQSKNVISIVKSLQQKYNKAKIEICKLRRETEMLKRSHQSMRQSLGRNPENYTPASIFTPQSMNTSSQMEANDSVALSITPQHMLQADAPRNYRQPQQQIVRHPTQVHSYARAAPQQPHHGSGDGKDGRRAQQMAPPRHHQQPPPPQAQVTMDTSSAQRYQEAQQQRRNHVGVAYPRRGRQYTPPVNQQRQPYLNSSYGLSPLLEHELTD